MKTFREFREELVEENAYPSKVIILRDRGVAWHAEFGGVKTTMGTGSTPEEALSNLLNPATGTGEDWELEDRKHRARMGYPD